MKMIPPYLPETNNLFVGILSGTSMNSIDAILINFSCDQVKIIAKINYPFNKKLARKLLDLINLGSCSLADLGSIDHQLGKEFAKAVNKLLRRAGRHPQEIAAIGSHGQNVWHNPHGKYPFTMQIGDPNIISANTNILTVSDFRRKDIAYGGQGAPLAPLFHAQFFRSTLKNRAIINIGGISNITILPKDFNMPIIGFDLGPGNCLMDEWVQTKFKSLQLEFDKNGALAAQGTVIHNLLSVCLKDRYFKQSPPKSTGREYFNQQWLEKKMQLAKVTTKVTGNKKIKIDILATLLYLTGSVIGNQVNKYNIEEVYICGGGANNKALMVLLKQIINCPVLLTNDLGIEVNWVEAALFAWLAKQTILGKTGNLPSVTGAVQAAILGAIYLPDYCI